MKKNLYRSHSSKVFGGVAGGIAEYFAIEPIIIRAIFIMTTLAWGGGILLYLVLWLITPEKPFEPEFVYDYSQNKYVKNEKYQAVANFESFDKTHLHKIFGSILIAIGGIILAIKLLPALEFGIVLPIILVAVGLLILMKPSVFKSGGYHESR